MTDRDVFGDGRNIFAFDLRIVKIVEVVEDGDVVPGRE